MRAFWYRLREPAIHWKEAWRRGQALLFLRAACFAAAVPVLTRLPPVRWQAFVEPSVPPPPAAPGDRERVTNCVLGVLASGLPLIRHGCLTRGLTLYYFLRRAGVDVALCFGMGPVSEGDGYDGHCWLVLEGEPYLEKRDPRPLYTEMYSISRRPLAAHSLQGNHPP